MFSSLRNNYEASKTLNKANGRFVTMKPRTPTVAARFHDSLQQLLESISGSVKNTVNKILFHILEKNNFSIIYSDATRGSSVVSNRIVRKYR